MSVTKEQGELPLIRLLRLQPNTGPCTGSANSRLMMNVTCRLRAAYMHRTPLTSVQQR